MPETTAPALGRTIPEMLQDRLQELLPKLPPDVAEACGKELWVYLEPRVVVSKSKSTIVPREKLRKRADRCVECDLVMYTRASKGRVGTNTELIGQPGAVKYGGNDRCQPCYRAWKKAQDA
jgi:hypothetical protein